MRPSGTLSGRMAEHPVLFNETMVTAILAGTKTQTRRPAAKWLARGYSLAERMVPPHIEHLRGRLAEAKRETPITA